MRHLKSKKILTFTQGHKKAIINGIVRAVFIHKKIETTYGKAKATQALLERIITYAKKGGLNAYRLVESKVHDQRLTKRIVEEIVPNYKDRNGGYTRIIKSEPRKGDNANMVIFELVGDFTLTPFGIKKKKEVKKDDKETVKDVTPKKKVVKKVVVDKSEKPAKTKKAAEEKDE